jgi:hypothetical protein
VCCGGWNVPVRVGPRPQAQRKAPSSGLSLFRHSRQGGNPVTLLLEKSRSPGRHINLVHWGRRRMQLRRRKLQSHQVRKRRGELSPLPRGALPCHRPRP